MVWLKCHNPDCGHEWQMDKVVCPKWGMESGETFVKKENVKSEG